MENLVTINQSNSRLLSDYLSNVLYDAFSQDRMLSEIVKLPGFDSGFKQVIDESVNNMASQGLTIDLNKLSNLDSSSLQQLDDTSTSVRQYNGELGEDVPIDEMLNENLALAAMIDQNVKTAFLSGLIKGMGILVKNSKPLANFLKTIIPKISKAGGVAFWASIIGPEAVEMFQKIVAFFQSFAEKNANLLDQVTDPTFWREFFLEFQAYEAIDEAKRSEMYAPSAFEKILETKEKAGYGDQYHSEGAYNVVSDDMRRQMTQQLQMNPDIAKSRFSDNPNLGPGIRKRMEQYTSPNVAVASNKNRFVKVAQEASEQSKNEIETVEKLMPQWTMNTVLREVYAIYQSPNISKESKEEAINATINKYLVAAKPLKDYLAQNFNVSPSNEV